MVVNSGKRFHQPCSTIGFPESLNQFEENMLPLRYALPLLTIIFWLAAYVSSPPPIASLAATNILPTPTETPHPDDGILLGAIRWDAWFGGSPYINNLFPEEWRYRLPFYATVSEVGQAQMASDSQGVMDQEILYAAANGIDYWIFMMYILRDEQGNPIVDETGWRAEDMNRSRQYYLSSPYKHLVRFALNLPVQGYEDSNLGEHNWNFQVEEAVTQMQEPSYQTVLDGRPLVYFFLWGQDVGRMWGSWERMREMLDDFRRYAQEKGLQNPYIVAMVVSAEEGRRAVNELGADGSLPMLDLFQAAMTTPPTTPTTATTRWRRQTVTCGRVSAPQA